MSVLGRGLARWFARPAGWLAVGFLLRLGHMITLGNRYYFGDTFEYEQLALRILHGFGLQEASPRAPVYPLFLALSFRLGGEGNFVFARLLQLPLSVALMLVVVAMARRFGGAAAATLAAAGIAVAPTIVFASGLLYPTLIYALLLASLTLVAWDLSERPGLLRGAGFGALAVVAWLTDMVILAPLLVIGGWLALRVRRAGPPLVRAMAMAAISAVVLAMPLVLQSGSPRGERVFMGKAQAVLYFARGDTMIAKQRWIRVPPGTPFVALSPRAFLAREAGLFVARPGAYVHDYAIELLHFFKPLPDRVASKNRFNTPGVLMVGAVYFVALLALALLGLARGPAPPRARWLLAAIVLGTAAFYALFFTQTRYRIPVEPHLIVLAALGAQGLFPGLSRALAERGAGGVGQDA